MLGFDFLRVPFARARDFRRQLSGGCAPISRIKTGEATGLTQGVAGQKNRLLTATTDVGEPRAGVVIDGLPEPAWVAVVAAPCPQLRPLRLRFPSALAGHRPGVWGVGASACRGHRFQPWGFLPEFTPPRVGTTRP